MKKKGKRLCSFFLSILICAVSFVVPVSASSVYEDDPGLETITVDRLLSQPISESLADLEALGLVLPEVYQEDRHLAEESLRGILLDISNGMTDVYPYGYTELVKYAKRVQGVLARTDPQISAHVARAYSLVDSTVLGGWSSNYNSQNCYGYALRRQVKVNPGHYSGGDYSIYLDISVLADLVVADLESLGYVAYKTSTKPTSIAYYEEPVMCIRKGPSDYHFMRMASTSSTSIWNHKPGESIPLRWNYSSPEYKTWTSEFVDSEGIAHPGNYLYNSEIYYIHYWSSSGPGPDINRVADVQTCVR